MVKADVSAGGVNPSRVPWAPTAEQQNERGG